MNTIGVDFVNFLIILLAIFKKKKIFLRDSKQ